MEPILSIDNVSLAYNSESAETLALSGLSLDVAKGEFLAIVGPSGCGKSSILSLIAGLIRPGSGSVRLRGKVVTGPSSSIGYMFQRDHLFEWRTVWQNVLLGLQVRRMVPQGMDRAIQLLKTYGLYEFRNQYPSELSGGMRQRAALIRTLAADPELLLLDEPFSALDYQTRLALGDEISAIIRNEKKTALFVTHDIAEAISIADRVILLTKRPATVKRILTIDMPGISPLKRRKQPSFQDYFDTIWKEMDVHV
jgi:NitT/TauT family transport system ATP-binding protein